jgi:hypothetical protein
MTTVAICQPPYFGWLGFWDMLAQADTMVLLDTVAISRQSWQTRNRVRQPDGRTAWLSVPVNSRLGQRLDTVRIDNSRDWARKHWATLQTCYERTPYWLTVEWLKNVYANPPERLADLTSSIITEIAIAFDIPTSIIRASDLPETGIGKIARIADILEMLKADEYLTTRGATYLHDMKTIGPAKIIWHDYTPTPYHQGGLPFDGHLAIIDRLTWTGQLPTSAPSATLSTGTSRA